VLVSVAGTELVLWLVVVADTELVVLVACAELVVLVIGTSVGMPVDLELVLVKLGTSVGIQVGVSSSEVEVCE
jgi:hypothetical protein